MPSERVVARNHPWRRDGQLNAAIGAAIPREVAASKVAVIDKGVEADLGGLNPGDHILPAR
jgi:hypothetical protein